MKNLMFGVLALGAISLMGINATPAAADGFGLHVSGRGYHFDVGRGGGRHRSFYGQRYRSYGGWNGHSGWHDDHSWHDTSHYDYHPGGFVPHYDHYDYVPDHYDFHQDGHWDHHHW